MASKRMSIREEMRVLGEAADDAVGTSSTNDWLTPEFWSMVVASATNLVAVAVVMGWLSATDAETLTKALSALLGASQVILVNAALVWKYIASRASVKRAAIEARYAYMSTALELQRIRAEREET